jgi:hypothetical protein
MGKRKAVLRFARGFRLFRGAICLRKNSGSIVAALSKKLRSVAGGLLSFFCPACNDVHTVRIGDHGWSYNGDPYAPTFSPSIKCSYPHPEGYSNKRPAPVGWQGKEVVDICHSFVEEGRIRYLDDCTHAFAGKTVDLPEWTE